MPRIVGFLAFLLVGVAIHVALNQAVRDAYMVRSRARSSVVSLLCRCSKLFLTNCSATQCNQDEEFHVKMVQQYCAGNYRDWDSKITTFPGLYLVSWGAVLAYSSIGKLASIVSRGGLAAVSGLSLAQLLEVSAEDCRVSLLRGVSLVLGLAALLAVYFAAKQVEELDFVEARFRGQLAGALVRAEEEEEEEEKKVGGWCGSKALRTPAFRAAVRAAVVYSMPVLYFYQYLVYTDLVGLLFVALTFVWTNRVFPVAAASKPSVESPWVLPSPTPGFISLFAHGIGTLVLGLCAVGMRQTNIVWVGLCVALQLLRQARWHALRDALLLGARGDKRLVGVKDGKGAGKGKGEVRTESDREGAEAHALALVDDDAAPSFGASLHQLAAWVAACPRVLPAQAGPLALVALFLAFLRWNDWSVVVGDKSNHTFTLHLAQLLYLSLFLALSLGPVPHIRAIGEIASAIGRGVSSRRNALALAARAIVVVAACSLVYIVQVRFSILHRFLTDDNRHYTFYLIRAVQRLPVGKALFHAALAPGYVYSLFTVNRAMGESLLDRVALSQCGSVLTCSFASIATHIAN